MLTLSLIVFAAGGDVSIDSGTGAQLVINAGVLGVVGFLYRRDAKRSDDAITQCRDDFQAERDRADRYRNDLASLNAAFMDKPLSILTAATVALEKSNDSSRVNAELAAQLLREVQRLTP